MTREQKLEQALNEAFGLISSWHGPADGSIDNPTQWSDADALDVCRQIDAALSHEGEAKVLGGNETLNLLNDVRKFIEAEYADPAAEPDGEWIAKEARPIHGRVCHVLANFANDAALSTPRGTDASRLALRPRRLLRQPGKRVLTMTREQKLDAAIRDAAVSVVDGLAGHTMEFSGSPRQHERDYDLAEEWIKEYVLPALSTPKVEAVAVKPLVWEPWENQRHGYNNRLIAARAETPFNAYFLEHDDGSGRWWVTDYIMGSEIAGPFGDEQEARAAAQAHHDRRVMSALAEQWKMHLQTNKVGHLYTSPAPAITDEAVERAAIVFLRSIGIPSLDAQYLRGRYTAAMRDALLAAFPSRGARA